MNKNTLPRRKPGPRKFFIAMMGPGEIGQGMAFARYAHKRGSSLILTVPESHYLPLVTKQIPNAKVLVTSNAKQLNKAISDQKPDLLILCNSKIFTNDGEYMDMPPVPSVPSLSIDSNWLFFPTSPFKANPWIDIYCLNFPKKVFEFGLKKNGGGYSIPKDQLKKIRLVGLLPSYKPLPKSTRDHTRTEYGVKKDEKLIFLYTSIGTMARPVVFVSAVETARALRKKGHKIRMIYFGDPPPDILDKDDLEWFIMRGRTSSETFARVLASSDLVMQHQGLGTLEQSIGAQIPVIAIVRDIKNEKRPHLHRHEWEVNPFARTGAAAMFYFDSPTNKISTTAEKLLFNNKARTIMRKKQKTLYSAGEKNVYNEGIKLLTTKKL